MAAPAFSSTRASPRTILAPLVGNNPITVQILGLCSALAVTSALLPALVMSIAVIAVLAFANVMVSLLRHIMPQRIRLIIEMTLIASAVIVVDQVLRAFMPEVSAVLSVFVGLIITNCIVLARVESFAMHNGVWKSLLDGLGNGLGYTWVLLLVGAVRELLGAGSMLGFRVFPVLSEEGGWFRPNEFMLLAPSAFFIVGLLIWLVGSRRATEPDAAERFAPEPRGESHD
jgi:Na+-transporting NADH:ubiquinone oxidoreductase subunit D